MSATKDMLFEQIKATEEVARAAYKTGYDAGLEQGWHDAMAEVLKRLDEMLDKVSR